MPTSLVATSIMCYDDGMNIVSPSGAMRVTGYDAETFASALKALDSINDLNGIVTAFVPHSVTDLLVNKDFLWLDEDGDAYADGAFYTWRSAGGDARSLALALGLEIEISL